MDVHITISGSGSHLPDTVWTNEELICRKGVDSTPEWIRNHTGIEARHVIGDGQVTSDMAFAAAQAAMENARLSPADIGLIICATMTAEQNAPAVAAVVQGRLGCNLTCPAFDVNAACAGFPYALEIARNMMAGCACYKHAIVIGAEALTRILDWEDRRTCILFGDGAGAVVLSRAADTDRGILGIKMGGNGALTGHVYIDGGPGNESGKCGKLRMPHGREVKEQAIAQISAAIGDVLAGKGLTLSDLDLVVPHQANFAILQGIADHTHFPVEKMVWTGRWHGNTSAASIPLAFDWARKIGRLREGDLFAFGAIGSGMMWAGGVAKL